MTTVYNFTVRAADGSPHPLDRYKGRVLLIVNTASQCGFTPQYEGLEQLWRDRREAGLTVLGFPCNQFGKQEPGDADEIARFCGTTYGVTFPILGKIEVNGAEAEPLYNYLTRARRGLFGTRAIKWNFTKFLVGRDGRPIARFAPSVRPTALRGAIDDVLGRSAG